MEKTKRIWRRNPVYLIWKRFVRLYLVAGFLLRVILMVLTPSNVSYSLWDGIRIFVIGAISDLCMTTILLLPMVVIYLGLNEWKYRYRAGWIIELLLLSSTCYVCSGHSVFNEYGGGAPLIAMACCIYKLASFTLRLAFPSIRKGWRLVTLYTAWATYVFFCLCCSVAEYFFWQEFGVRLNFIAVDYLVYTHEVIGNIFESYSLIIPLIVIAVMLTGFLVWKWSRHERFKYHDIYTVKLLGSHLAIYTCLAVVSMAVLNLLFSHADGSNQYVTQLQHNGIYDFYKAFRSSSLDYRQFYELIPDNQCQAVYRQMTQVANCNLQPDTCNLQPVNIVLISVESLSASFLKAYGNTLNLTPCLDSLMDKSLVFDSLYAVGNRTVRGLEALTLCIPPSAGESLVKRDSNRMGPLSVGNVMTSLGYKTLFFYGGDSRFDNMEKFFSGNGYEVIDRNRWDNTLIVFSNIWGVSDEDTYNHVIRRLDRECRAGNTFFAHIMTVSNHRPFTFPKGRITMEGNPKSREGAVKYSDYAIGQFLRQASSKPWFRETVFVITADHCASSAGKTSLPLDCYHIPCLIYAPQTISPQRIKTVCSQMDILPTLLALLGISYEAPFAGSNILSADYQPRAFVATYQDLGLYEQGILTVLSPVRRVRQYRVTPRRNSPYVQTEITHLDSTKVLRTQACYQYVNTHIKGQ